MQSRRIIAGGIITFILVSSVLGVVFLLISVYDRDDGNPKLRVNFEKHRAAFDSLVTMFREDRGLCFVSDAEVSYDRHAPGLPIPLERLSTYRRLLKDTGCLSVSHSYALQPGVYFDYADHGMFFSGWTKGYCSCILLPPLVVENVDEFSAQAVIADTGQVFQRIEGDWYLYREYAQ